MKKTKGIRSRQEILDQARKFYNEEGIGLTIAELAKKLDTTQGKITYYFPTKEQLFLALVQEFESTRSQFLLTYEMASEGLDGAYARISEVMDLQYNYRCVHRFLVSAPQYKGENYNIFIRISEELRDLVTTMITGFVNAGSIDKRALQPKYFNILFFKLATLFRSWVVSLELYDQDKSYEEVKPVYLLGIISTFHLYATEKGLNELKSIGIPL
jgi:AcrR family transcriptional regulator